MVVLDSSGIIYKTSENQRTKKRQQDFLALLSQGSISRGSAKICQYKRSVGGKTNLKYRRPDFSSQFGLALSLVG